jgi:hypothetical protein
MQSRTVYHVLIYLFILLFAYSGAVKLIERAEFVNGIRVQPVPAFIKTLLIHGLPFIELLTALALVFKKSRRAALYVFGCCMLVFSIYTGLAGFQFFEREPCGCGGVIGRLGWKGHFFLNLFFLAGSCIATVTDHQIKNLCINRK